MMGHRTFRWARLSCVVMATVLAIGACSNGDDKKSNDSQRKKPSSSASPSQSMTRTPAPAAAAGGLCAAFDYATLKQALNLEFSVAAAGGDPAGSQSCVLRHDDQSHPYLSLARVGGGTTPEAFRADFQPADGTAVEGLHEAGYSRVVAASGTDGPRAEVGWLRAGGIYLMSVTTAPGTTPENATQLAASLVEQAKQLQV